MSGSDDMMFEYLLQMGSMQPEMQDMKRKQAMVDALRGKSMDGPQGQMIGKHYVAPSMTQYMQQLGTGAMAGADQRALTDQYARMNAQQRQNLEEMRRRRGMGQSAQPTFMGYGGSVSGENLLD